MCLIQIDRQPYDVAAIEGRHIAGLVRQQKLVDPAQERLDRGRVESHAAGGETGDREGVVRDLCLRLVAWLLRRVLTEAPPEVRLDDLPDLIGLDARADHLGGPGCPTGGPGPERRPALDVSLADHGADDRPGCRRSEEALKMRVPLDKGLGDSVDVGGASAGGGLGEHRAALRQLVFLVAVDVDDFRAEGRRLRSSRRAA